MQLSAFRVQMFKRVIDSGWIQVEPLTVLVGKNESGKTTLLKALHKLNPFVPEPYNIQREWPRGHRGERNDEQAVCTARFSLGKDELSELAALTGVEIDFKSIDISRDYAGRIEVHFPEGISPNKLHPTDIDETLKLLPIVSDPVADEFKTAADECKREAVRLAKEGRFSDLSGLQSEHSEKLRKVMSPNNPQPQNSHEQAFISQWVAKLQDINSTLRATDSIHKKAHDYIVKRLPTFVYMDEYRSFRGTAMLDQVKHRMDRGQLNEDDKTLMTILALAHLDINDLVRLGGVEDREERQYDLDDGAVTLTSKIEEHWGQLRYDVKFGADGQQFFTWVKAKDDRALIRLEERSRGFQWFFSFDLLLLHETRGSFSGCVVLLDEPGLHLHPEGQRDLLARLEEYARGNTLIYSTHLPFMIDLQEPERIRVLSETADGVKVTENLTHTQPEGKLTLQAGSG